MKSMKLMMAVALMATATMATSCLDDDSDDVNLRRPTALVTVYPSANGSFAMQLDDSTTLVPTNLSKSPFGDKEVRALVNYTEQPSRGAQRSVQVNWIDSIRTKQPVLCTTHQEANAYGSDPVDIVKDWVTVAEDGYLTLRVRTKWSNPSKVHTLSLVSGLNPDDPFEVELHHDAHGDTVGQSADALVAFNLNSLATDADGQKVLRLKWVSSSGVKTTEFKLNMHKNTSAK